MSPSIEGTSAQDKIRTPILGIGKKSVLISVAICLVAALSYGTLGLTKTLSADIRIPVDNIRSAQVVRGNLIRNVSATGRIVVANSPTLFSPEQGAVNLLVKAGDRVSIGQVLATIESPELGELLAREQAELTRLQLTLAQQEVQTQQEKMQRTQLLALAKVELNANHREMRRAKKSFENQLISEFDFEEVRDNLARSKLTYDQATQNLSLSEDSLNFFRQAISLQTQSQSMVIKALERRIDALTIVSPVEGMVGKLEVSQQQVVESHQALISVVDLSTYEIEASVAEGLAKDINPGMQAIISLFGNEYTATVNAISPEVVQGEVAVRLTFAGTIPKTLRQNQRLSVAIELENRPNTLLVQRGPFFDRFTDHVFKINGNQAHRITVKTGTRSLREVEILNGLAEGDTIIISNIDASASKNTILLTQ